MFVCTFYAPMPISESSHGCMLGFMSSHVYVLNFYVYMHVSMPICLCLCFHMLVCLDLCSLYVSCYIPCACALHAMFVCLGLGYVCHATCYYSPFVALSSFFFLVFWLIGLDSIWTPLSLSSSAHLSPHQRVWIIPICMSMLACFYAFFLC